MTFGVDLIPNNNTQQRKLGNSENKWDINANTINATTINGNNVTNGVKTTQSAVADPTAEGTSLEFIDSISQNTQGVITPTKKEIPIANNLTEITAGKVLDATQGKILKDAIDNLDTEINSLDAEDVGAIKADYNYTYMGSPYTGNELILLHNTTTGVNNVTDVASFLSSAGGGSGTNQGALVHYTKTISVNAGSTAQTFPNSGTDDNITENMVVLQAVISNPAAQGSDWTFTTANGTVTLNGTVNAATNVTLYFGVSLTAAPSIQVNLSSNSSDNILKTNPQPGVMGVLGTVNGGTGVNATDAADLRSKLGITPANISAVAKTGDTMTGPLNVRSDGIALINPSKGNLSLYMHISNVNNGEFGIYSNGYYNGSNFVSDSNWLVYRDINGVTRLGNAVPVDNGGTGATTAAGARTNLGIRYKDVSIPVDAHYQDTDLSTSNYDIISVLVTNPYQSECYIKGVQNMNGLWRICIKDTVLVGAANVRILYIEK